MFAVEQGAAAVLANSPVFLRLVDPAGILDVVHVVLFFFRESGWTPLALRPASITRRATSAICSTSSSVSVGRPHMK